MLSVESFDTNKYILLYSPYISSCYNEDILLQIFGFRAIFSICFPLLLTYTSYLYIKSALPIMFFLFLSLSHSVLIFTDLLLFRTGHYL